MAQKELTIEKTFNAPPQSVWKALTDQNEMEKWFGPEGFSTPVVQIDPKVGGKIYLEMEDVAGYVQKGMRSPMEGEFKELTPPTKMVYSANPLVNGKPAMETLITINLTDESGKTKMNLYVEVVSSTPEAEPMLQGMKTGWNQSLDKLAKLLENK